MDGKALSKFFNFGCFNSRPQREFIESRAQELGLNLSVTNLRHERLHY